MKRRVRRVLADPIIIMVPFALVMLVGWNRYIYNSLHLDKARTNLMPAGNFQSFDNTGVPLGWQYQKSGEADSQLSSVDGYSGKKSLLLTLESYKKGSVSLASPIVNVEAGRKYLFRSYFMTDMPFDLLMRTYYVDGSSRLALAHTYRAGGMSTWSTTSQAFTGESGARAVQFVYRFSRTGTIRLDENFLEQRNNVYVEANAKPNGYNLVPNGGPHLCSNTPPPGWSSYTFGKNAASFIYGCSEGQAYTRTQIANYHDGEAKWQYAPTKVLSGQYLQMSLSYQSDRPADLVAEYERDDGTRQFVTITTLNPANEWTNVTKKFEAPAHAKNLFVAAVLRTDGTLDTRDYAMYDISKPGQATFRKPIVSITFDGGWRSAYTSGIPQLNNNHLKATFFITPLTLDTKRFLTKTQVNDLVAQDYEVAAHSHQHVDLSTLNAQEVNVQLKRSYRYVNQITGRRYLDFASPFGVNDPVTQFYLRRYFQSARGVESGINTRQNLDPYNLKVLTVTHSTSDQQIQKALQEARDSNGWLILVYDHIENNTNSQAVAPATFSRHLRLVRDSHIPVATVTEAISQIKPLL